MGNRVELSVVVPVYNAASTLDRCIQSLLTQDTIWSYEILFVNDGSTDNSEQILENWRQLDERIIMLSQKNSGVSEARNKGLAQANGRFVIFVDSDDWVGPKYLQNLRNSVIAGKKGITIAGICFHTAHSVKERMEINETFSPSEFHSIFEQFQLCSKGHIASKIFNLGIIKEFSIQFSSSIHYGEDLLFFLHYLQYAEYIRFSNHIDYHYIRPEHITLTNKYNSFESEIKGYREFRDGLMMLQKKYHIHSIELYSSYRFLLYFALRAVKTIYRPGVNYKPRRKRLDCLKEGFDERDRVFLDQYGRYSKGIDWLTCRCISRQKYKLADYLLSAFFRLRYCRLTQLYLSWYRANR
jgi:glycosyltransferase involved in cell wall biosynthesis